VASCAWRSLATLLVASPNPATVCSHFVAILLPTLCNDSIGAVHSGHFPETAHRFSPVPQTGKGIQMDSVYKVIELVGTSSESWEKAAKNAIDVAAKSLHDLRIAEVVKQDLMIEDDKVVSYRTKVRLSFKYHSED
jgi:hypothetical protein